jgi:hypothetical protein
MAARALSFGAVADTYDCYRPAPPERGGNLAGCAAAQTTASGGLGEHGSHLVVIHVVSVVCRPDVRTDQLSAARRSASHGRDHPVRASWEHEHREAPSPRAGDIGADLCGMR